MDQSVKSECLPIWEVLFIGEEKMSSKLRDRVAAVVTYYVDGLAMVPREKWVFRSVKEGLGYLKGDTSVPRLVILPDDESSLMKLVPHDQSVLVTYRMMNAHTIWIFWTPDGDRGTFVGHEPNSRMLEARVLGRNRVIAEAAESYLFSVRYIPKKMQQRIRQRCTGKTP